MLSKSSHSIVTFFLSAVLDNLTTTIVIVSLTEKLSGSKATAYFCGVAANARSAWSAIGDATTTMLWIGGIAAASVPALAALALFVVTYLPWER